MSSSFQHNDPPDPASEGGSGAISQASGQQALRSVALLLARHQISNLRRWFEEFDRDILLPILLGEIALRNIDTPEADGGRGERAGSGNPDEGGNCEGEDASSRQSAALEVARAATLQDDCAMKPCNAYSIAAATGLPRETVRRKIVRLIELGWITRTHNGHLYISREALAHFGSLLSSRELSELLETAARARAMLDASSP